MKPFAIRPRAFLLPWFAAVALAVASASAQDTAVYSTIHRFDGRDGSTPGNLVEGDDGNFYGTTSYGGFGYDPAYGGTGYGTVFRITPAGELTTIHAFAGAADGQNPYGLSKGRDGNFYGLTTGGPTNTVFRITPAGDLRTIYASPSLSAVGPLAQDFIGNFYGVSYSGGPESMDYGSVFRLTTAGEYTTLHVFTGDGDDGAAGSPLTRGSDGSFYATGNLGTKYSGTVYQITSAGVFKSLHVFTGETDGFLPNGLTLGPDGNLYGTTLAGGADFYGVVYRITSAGEFTVLYNFTGGGDSGVPVGDLVLGRDGNFYGVASGDTLPEAMPFRAAAQPASIGIIPPIIPTPHAITVPSKMFRVTPAGVLTPLYASETTIGQFIQGNDGGFYGADDVINNEGSLFKLSVVSHPAFFTGQIPLTEGVEYLAFPNGNIFGYYVFLNDPNYLYHFDLGYEYLFGARDGRGGVYLYDFASGGFFYTSPIFPFPYLYDFSLKSVVYYFPDPDNAGHYNTNGVRYFYNFATGTIITK